VPKWDLAARAVSPVWISEPHARFLAKRGMTPLMLIGGVRVCSDLWCFSQDPSQKLGMTPVMVERQPQPRRGVGEAFTKVSC
jgi:hypothetical protein